MSEFPSQREFAGGERESESEPLSRLVARYWVLFKKYYWILIATCALGVVGAYFYTQQQPKIYQASTKIIFRETPSNVFGRSIERVDLVDPGGMWQFEQFWNTQREVMRSRWFAEKVVEFEGLIDEQGFISTSATDREKLKKIAAGKVLGSSDVSLQPGSRVAIVTAETTDPEHARLVADGIADTYVQYTRDFQSGGLSKIIEWFDDYVGQKRAELSEAQAELHRFKKDKNILSISYEERQNLTAANMEAVNSQLNSVRAQLDADDALLRQLKKMESGNAEDAKAIAHIVDSPVLDGAIEAEQQLQRELANVTTMYGERHEKVQAISRQLETVRNTIEKESARIRRGVQARVDKLRTEETTKNARLESLKQEAFELNELGLEYSQMKDRADSLKQLYDTVLKRSEELDINSMYESQTIEVLQRAETPGSPVRPSMPINLAIGLAMGLLLGGGLIVLIDSLDNTVRAESDITRLTAKPILGHLPQIDAALLREFGSIDTMTEIAPRSSFAEGIKTLRTNLMFMTPDKPPEMLLVTSPGPGEGKTLISINMAIAMAQSGLRTLIVDSDMRRPRVHKALNIVNDLGLSNLIQGNATLDEVTKTTQTENLFAISCGEIPPNPLELLHTESFNKFLDEMREKYDRVILDSPPLAAVSDGLVLSHSVDAVVLILKFGQTRRELLKRSIEQLEAVGAPFMGCVLNDISADAGSAYAYSYYYYRYKYEEDDPGKPTRLAS